MKVMDDTIEFGGVLCFKLAVPFTGQRAGAKNGEPVLFTSKH